MIYLYNENTQIKENISTISGMTDFDVQYTVFIFELGFLEPKCLLNGKTLNIKLFHKLSQLKKNLRSLTARLGEVLKISCMSDLEFIFMCHIVYSFKVQTVIRTPNFRFTPK